MKSVVSHLNSTDPIHQLDETTTKIKVWKTKLGHVHLYGFNRYFSDKCASLNEQTQNITLF